MGRLDGKVAVLAGGAGYLGCATARLFAKEGASVVIADINGEKARTLVTDITAAGGKAASVVVDLTDQEQVKRMVDFAVETYGRIDVLEHLAMAQPGRDSTIIKTTDEVWEKSLKVNLFGPIWCCRHAILTMLETGGGSIILMSSMGYDYGGWEELSYGTSKAAVSALTKYVATTYGKEGIRVNVIAAGFSAPVEAMAARPGGATFLEVFEQHTLTPRFGNAMDQAYLALFLASDESGYITGQTIRCNGGMGTAWPTAPQLRAARTSTHFSRPAEKH